jgi:hypothetical protein
LTIESYGITIAAYSHFTHLHFHKGVVMPSKEIIRGYCIQKLASQIGQNSEKGIGLDQESSAKIDWGMAQWFIDYHSCNRPGTITDELNRKGIEEYSFENFDRDYGRLVWDSCYQSVKRHLRSPIYVNIKG